MWEYKIMTTYTINISEDMGEKVTTAVLKQIKKATSDGGVIKACDVILTYLNPVPEKDFKDSGFTDDFGVHME